MSISEAGLSLTRRLVRCVLQSRVRDFELTIAAHLPPVVWKRRSMNSAQKSKLSSCIRGHRLMELEQAPYEIISIRRLLTRI